MNLPYFIAQRLIKGRREETSFSRPINVIAIIGIAMGLAVMILAVSILTGFKKEIREKLRLKHLIRNNANKRYAEFYTQNKTDTGDQTP
jgi:ABC-type lipoprotein release transport system permease subunit